jgi:hypothetical protein
VGHLLLEAALEGSDEAPPALALQRDGAGGMDEVGGPHLAVVDRGHHCRIRQQRPERLHQVKRERGATVARLMIEAPVRVEADRRQGDGQRSHKQRVGERQECVNRVGRRAAVALGKIESERRSIGPENAPEF